MQQHEIAISYMSQDTCKAVKLFQASDPACVGVLLAGVADLPGSGGSGVAVPDGL